MLREHYSAHGDTRDLVEKLSAARPAAIYFGGYRDDIARIVRSVREAGISAEIFGPNALNASEFWVTAGSAGEGVRYTDVASARGLSSAQGVEARFRADGYEPEGYTLNAYAAVEAWVEGVRRAGSLDAAQVAAALRSSPVETVAGTLEWDAKGDLKVQRWIWYVWRQGRVYAQ